MQVMKKFECRLTSEPGVWKVLEAKDAADAAEKFAFAREHADAAKDAADRTWRVARGAAHMMVVVRSIDNTDVSATYRVLGRLAPEYTASLVVPGTVPAANAA